MTRSTLSFLMLVISISGICSVTMSSLLNSDNHILRFIVDVVIVGAVAFGFNEWGWRLPLWRWLKLTTVPVIAGDWDVRIVSSYNDNSEISIATVHIYQRWLNISIRFTAPDSISQTENVTFEPSTIDGEYELRYIYHAIPTETIEYALEPYYGMSILVYRSEKQLSGYYQYYDRLDENFVRGQIVFNRL